MAHVTIDQVLPEAIGSDGTAFLFLRTRQPRTSQRMHGITLSLYNLHPFALFSGFYLQDVRTFGHD